MHNNCIFDEQKKEKINFKQVFLQNSNNYLYSQKPPVHIKPLIDKHSMLVTHAMLTVLRSTIKQKMIYFIHIYI